MERVCKNMKMSEKYKMPATREQMGLWLIHQMKQESNAYNIAGVLEFDGKLDRTILEESVQEIIKKHESLRTNLHFIEGSVQQIIHSELKVPLNFIDLEMRKAEEKEWDKLVHNESIKVFDLENEPLLHFTLVRFNNNHHRLIIVMHHIIADGWSVKVLIDDLTNAYNSLLTEGKSNLDELDIQFADYAAWQDQNFQENKFDQAISYWKGKFNTAFEPLDLPKDNKTDVIEMDESGNFTSTINKQLYNNIKIFCEKHQITPYMFLMSAFAFLLNKFSRNSNIIIGTPVANRPFKELEGVIGNFVNTLPIVFNIDPNTSVSNYINNAKEEISLSFTNQSLPFSEIVKAIAPERAYEENPLTNIMFVMQNMPKSSLNLNDLEIRSSEINAKQAKFDMTMFISEENNIFNINFEYKKNLWHVKTVSSLIHAYTKILNEFIKNPEEVLSDINIFNENFHTNHSISKEKNNFKSPMESIIKRFEQNVTQNPSKACIEDGKITLDYLTVSNKVNQSTTHLLNKGVKEGDFVGIYMSRSSEFIIQFLSVIKAGGCAVLLDKSLPKQRVESMLKRDNVSYLITEKILDFDFKGKIIIASDIKEMEYDESLIPKENINNPLYMIYTSGSTGLPKGVIVNQRQFLNYLNFAENTYIKPFEGEYALLHSSISFDLTLTSVFLPLFSNLTIIIKEDDEINELKRVICSKNKFRFIKLTPSHLDILNQEFDSWYNHISCLIVGGEQLYNHHIQKIENRDMVIFNEYGPTETTVGCSIEEIRYPFNNKNITIGREIPNVSLYILDENLNVLPPGFPGELYIGGDSVSNGYHQNPKNTSQLFIPDHLSDIPSKRLYRSGDICRFNYDGKIEYIGRKDEQVKIRGYRIETGEVENTVKTQFKEVKRVSVIPSKDHYQLLCYYTSDSELNSEKIYKRLLNVLPKYMIPNLFIKLDSIPLTSNGKLDKKKLPYPDFNLEILEEDSYPKTETEKKLLTIFCDILKINKINVEKSFFHYGGHSLLVMSVISRIKESFSVDLSLKAFLKSPTIRDIAETIDSLEPSTDSKLIPKVSDNPAVASFGQEQLLLINEINPESHEYNIPGGFEFTGEINLPAMKRAWEQVILRHEILRTQFVKEDSSAYQLILDEVELPFTYIDLSQDEKPLKGWEELCKYETHRIFDLETAPLFHISLVKLNEHTHRLLFVIHHIIFDGWSNHLLIKDFFEYYQQYDDKNYKNSLLPLEIQYRDYAAWQKKQESSELFNNQIKYWVKKFKNGTETLELPTDFPRGISRDRKGLHLITALHQETVTKLKDYAFKTDSTMFSLLISCFGLMLQRYSGNEKIIVGVPVANRNVSTIEDLIGYFVNTISISLDGANNPTFNEYLEKNKQDISESMSNQEVPFEKVVQAINPERNINNSSLFQVMFVLQNTPTKEVELPNISVKSLNIESYSAKFDLMVIVEEQVDGNLIVNFEYDTNLFKKETIISMADVFEQIINSCISDPYGQLNTISVIPEKQKSYLLQESFTRLDSETLDQTFSQLFYNKTQMHSDKIAVEDDERILTYKDLWNESVKVSKYLLDNDFNQGDILPIIMDRSSRFLSSMIGTFNIRGAYVPIDPYYPIGRINNILNQINCKVVLSERKFSDIFSQVDSDIKVIYYEDLPTSVGLFDSEILQFIKEGKPRDLSYIIFTSGSTGPPKGAMVEQKGMVNHLYSKIEDLGLAEDKIIQNASQSFDISVWQNLVSLLTGGSVYITNQEVSTNPIDLFQYQADKEINILEVVPSFLRAALDMDISINTKALKYLLVTGEVLPVNLSNRFYRKFPNVKLVNAYGPTECSDDVTHYFVPVNQSENLISVPIGKKIINTNIYILDKHLNLVPDGVPGELYISGEGVGRGYYNNPKLTAINFIPNPYSDRRASRLYKTGDLCRHVGNGVYQFINRKDRQVKVRGFRIELGEIEQAIMQMEEVNDCVVWTYEQESHTRLVAYYLSKEEVDIDYFKANLSDKIPGYMIPSNFMKIDMIPLSLNGKIDYKQLPYPDANINTADKYVAPSSPLEVEISKIISEVLKIDNVSTTSNFFEIGGYSLTATQVINKINQRKNLSVPIRIIFEKPTIKELAKSIENEYSTSSQVNISKVNRNVRIPASYGQQQLLLINKIMPDDYSYNVSGAMELIGNINIEAFKSSISQIIMRHEVLRTVFYEEDGEFYQKILNAVPIPLEIVENKSWSDIVLEEGSRRFNFNKGPLFKLTLLKVAENDYKLMVVMHHIISDEWSIKILMEEVSYYYKAYQNQDVLPELEFQYADYANWQQRLLDSGVLNNQLSYWKEKLKGFNETLEIPSDFQRKLDWSNLGKNVSYKITEISKDTIKEICKENGVTPYVFLLSAFGVLLQKYSGMKNVTVGSPVLGRKNAAIEELIGYFVNTVVMKLDGRDNPSFKEFLSRVKEDTVDSLNNQDVPFEKVVEALHPVRNMEQNPLFQVMFVLNNLDMKEVDFPDVEVRTLPVHNDTAKFDLMFVIEEREDGYVVNIEFDKSLFKESTINNLFNSYKKIIEDVTYDQNLLLSEIEVMDRNSFEKVVKNWNQTEDDFPTDKTFSQLFKEAAIEHKEKICASDHENNLTYNEVWNRSCIVAAKLIANNINVGSHVSLYLERSTNFLVSMIGVFHSRAAYVPIDPNYPKTRATQILNQSKSDIIIAEKALAKDVEKISNGIPILYIEDLLETKLVDTSLVEQRIHLGKESDLSYVIFTSGSTGQPKGVMIEQKGMINHLFAKIRDLNIEKDTIIQNSSQSFDISVWQNLICLLTGGNVHIVNQEVAMKPLTLFSEANKVNATILEVVPSLLRAVLDLNESFLISNLRYLMVTGEALPNDICEKWYKKFPHIPIINAYGPTECSDDVTHYFVPTSIDEEPVPLPIGFPLSNIKIYILDDYLRPVPIGVKGELFIGGISVGRGYIDNPRETAKSFIPDPFSSEKGGRLYKSGDLCRYLPDGSIQFLGRLDHQVKIRGFRIEISEIELAIRKHKNISDCVVVPNNYNNQDCLVCYYVSEEKMQNIQFKDYLMKLLPSYMVPSFFIRMDELPLTPNGKINRAALPKPNDSIANFNQDFEYVAPKTDIEKQVATIMGNLLELPQVGLHNNFFDIGGHSLLVNKLVIEIEKEFSYTLGFRDFFENPSVEGLSLLITKDTEAKNNLISAIELLDESEAIELLNRIEKGESAESILKRLKL